MMKKWKKKLMAAVCTVSMLVTMPGMGVLADDLQEKSIVIEAENPEESVDSFYFPNDNVEDAADAQIIEEIIDQEEVEEVVGEGSIQVGDGVTATFDADTGTVKFTSQDGELWRDWVDKLGVDRSKIKSIRVISGTVCLPADSSKIFSIEFQDYNINGVKSTYSNLVELDLGSFDTSNVTNMSSMFSGCYGLSNLDLSSFDTLNVTDMSSMFGGCYNLRNLDLSSFDTLNVTDMSSMFGGCSLLSNLDLSSFDTLNVTDMSSMFSGCYGLRNLDLSNFDTLNVTDMSCMFHGCFSLRNLDLSSFDTLNVMDMHFMFYGCKYLINIDLSNFNTSNVTDMSSMFETCESLTSLELNSFDTSNVTTMASMFYACKVLRNLDLSNFNTSNVTNIYHMFFNCFNLTNLDLCCFNTSNVEDMGEMFGRCNSLQRLRSPMSNCKSISLPYAMYDSDGKEYRSLPNTTKSIVLARTQQMAQEYEGQIDKNYFSIKRGDHNSYSHTSDDFYKTTERQRYQTSYSTNFSNYIDTKTEEKRLLDALNKPWDGSCFGASASMVLKNLDIEEISSTNTYFNLGKPCDNTKLRDVINYYQVCQYLNEYSTDYRTVRGEISGLTIALTSVVSLKNFLKQFVAEAQKSQEERKPFLYNFSYKEKENKVPEGHTVIVCGIERADYDNDSISEYKVKIYDLNYDNDSPEYIYMYIEEDFSSFHFQDMNHKRDSDYLRSLINQGAMDDNIDWSQYNLENIWTNMSYVGIDKLENDSFYRLNRNENLVGLSEYENVVGEPDSDDKDNLYATVIIDADKPFVLENDQGKKLLYNGEYSGDLEIYAFDFILGETPKLKLQVLSSDKFLISEITEDFSVTADVDGNYYRASTTDANEITLSKDGIKIDGNDDYSFTAVVGTKMNDFELIQVSSTANGKISVSNDEEMVSVTSESPLQSIVVNAIGENQNNEVEYTVNENSVLIGEDDGVIQIGDVDILDCKITLSSTNYIYDGKAKKPAITVKYGTKELSQGTDYTVTYTNNTDAGTAVVKVIGIGNYKGEKSITFTINKASAKLAFAESALTKKAADAAFTNALTKTTDGIVTFGSSNTKVATVNSTSGLVTIKGVGTTTITVATSEGKNYKAGSAAYSLVVEASNPIVSGFSDVQDPSHPYYKAIYWAAEKKITGGYKDGTFGINKPCTRGHAVMFLWKMEGAPAPKDAEKTPFPDVPKTHPYYKAVLWAQQKGITKGYTFGSNKGKFGIDDTCTRGQIMTFIWNYKGKLATNVASKSPFSDVPTTHPYYKAILWGSKNGVTKGYTSGPNAGKFGINDNCTRGQIVKFLYNIR